MIQSVVIARFSFPYEAQMARASLVSAGIQAFVTDEHTINMDWFYSNALGGVRLHVSREDLEEARRILETDFSELVDEIFLDDGKDDVVRCRRCKSDQVYAFTQGERPAWMVFMLFGLPLVSYKHGLKCKDCGAYWY